MKHFWLIFIFLSFQTSVFAQKAEAYKFYNKKGKALKFEKVVQQASQYDVVLFGELHDNSMVHWLELRLEKALYNKKKNNLIIGAEMFERDNQQQLNQYLSGRLEAKVLKDSMRLWPNYETDYRPLVDFAKENQLPFIATNIPRRYASFVAKQGLDTLNTISSKEKEYMMKLPVEVSLETPGYEEMKTLMGEHAGNKIMNFISAQAVKDATMAESINSHIRPNTLFLHFAGDYHSKEYGGIYWYLKKLNPNLKIAIITITESEEDQLPFPNKDYIPTEFNLVVPADMTKTQ